MANETRLRGFRFSQYKDPIRNPFITYMGMLSPRFDYLRAEDREFIEGIRRTGRIDNISLGDNIKYAPGSMPRQRRTKPIEVPPFRTAAQHRAERERLKQMARENNPMWDDRHYVPMWEEPQPQWGEAIQEEPPKAEPPKSKPPKVNPPCETGVPYMLVNGQFQKVSPPLDELTVVRFNGHELNLAPTETINQRAERLVRENLNLEGIATFEDLVRAMGRSNIELTIANSEAALKAYYKLRDERKKAA